MFTQQGKGATRHCAIAPLVVKVSDGEREKTVRPVTVNLDIAISPITCAFTLRRCVRPSFAFQTIRYVHSMGEDFLSHATTQR